MTLSAPAPSNFSLKTLVSIEMLGSYVSVEKKRVRQLTDTALRVGNSEAKGSEEEDEHQVEEEVGEVDPGTKLVPLVVEETGHQRMTQELTPIVVHLDTHTASITV